MSKTAYCNASAIRKLSFVKRPASYVDDARGRGQKAGNTEYGNRLSVEFHLVHQLGQADTLGVQSTSAGMSEAVNPMQQVQPDHLTEARRISPTSVEVTFADGFVARLTLQELGLAVGEVDLRTAVAIDTGLMIKSPGGRRLVIDSATLRYLADPEHAANLDRSVDELLIPSDRLERIARKNQPPQEWYDSPEDHR